MRGLWQDLRYGTRLLRRSPAFTTTAVLVLALGIGVNTALFSIVNALFFTPLRVTDPSTLFYVYWQAPNGHLNSITGTRIDVLEAQAADVADFSSHSGGPVYLTIDGETEETNAEIVDGRYFTMLGVAVERGRAISTADTNPANPEAAMVISHAFWVRRFQSDPNTLGRLVKIKTVDGVVPYTIVGIAPAGFRGLTAPWEPAQIWLPYRTDGRARARFPVARLKPGATQERLDAFLQSAAETVKQNLRRNGYADGPMRYRPGDVDSLRFPAVRAIDTRSPFEPEAELIPPRLLAGLAALIGLVLVIATVNVTGLLLARGIARTGEVAVRLALGAGAARVIRQLLTEALVISISGGAIGLAVATTAISLFRSLVPPVFDLAVTIDWRVLLFAAVVCVCIGVVIGFLPGLRAARVNVLSALGRTGAASTRRSSRRIHRSIVVPQIALSLLLLIVASAVVRGLQKQQRIDHGYRTDGGVVLQINRTDPQPLFSMTLNDDERAHRASRERTRALTLASTLLDHVAAVPGIEHTALMERLPFFTSQAFNHVITKDDGASNTSVIDISEDYFAALGIAAVAGRTFEPHDVDRSDVVVISHALARALWPGASAIGRQIAFGTEGRFARKWMEVIGVAADTSSIVDSKNDPAVVYRLSMSSEAATIPFDYGTPERLVVRGSAPAAALIPALKNAVRSTDPFLDVARVQTTEEIVADLLYPRRAAAILLSASSLIALGLAAIGLYGLTSFGVAQRQRELGIRATLGADRRDLVQLMLRDGARVMALGTVAGVLCGIVAVRIAASLTPGLPSSDLIGFAIAPLALTAVVLIACYLPARRAARVDPADVLRAN